MAGWRAAIMTKRILFRLLAGTVLFAALLVAVIYVRDTRHELERTGDYNSRFLARMHPSHIEGTRLKVTEHRDSGWGIYETLLEEIGPPESDRVLTQIFEVWGRGRKDEALRREFSALYRSEGDLHPLCLITEWRGMWSSSRFDYVKGSGSALVRMRLDFNGDENRYVLLNDLPEAMRKCLTGD